MQRQVRNLDLVQGPSILLIQSGEGTGTAKAVLSDRLLDSCPQLGKGSVFFVPANTPLALTAGGAELVAWIAAVNSRVFADKFSLPDSEAFAAAPQTV